MLPQERLILPEKGEVFATVRLGHREATQGARHPVDHHSWKAREAVHEDAHGWQAAKDCQFLLKVCH